MRSISRATSCQRPSWSKRPTVVENWRSFERSHEKSNDKERFAGQDGILLAGAVSTLIWKGPNDQDRGNQRSQGQNDRSDHISAGRHSFAPLD
jgi:hypothetical protein